MITRKQFVVAVAFTLALYVGRNIPPAPLGSRFESPHEIDEGETVIYNYVHSAAAFPVTDHTTGVGYRVWGQVRVRKTQYPNVFRVKFGEQPRGAVLLEDSEYERATPDEVRALNKVQYDLPLLFPFEGQRKFRTNRGSGAPPADDKGVGALVVLL